MKTIRFKGKRQLDAIDWAFWPSLDRYNISLDPNDLEHEDAKDDYPNESEPTLEDGVLVAGDSVLGDMLERIEDHLIPLFEEDNDSDWRAKLRGAKSAANRLRKAIYA